MKCSLPFAIYEGTVHQFDPQSSLRLASNSFLDCLEQVSSTTNLHFHSSDLCQNCDGRIEAAKVPQNPVGCSFLFLLSDQGHKYSCFLSLQYDCHYTDSSFVPHSVTTDICCYPLLQPTVITATHQLQQLCNRRVKRICAACVDVTSRALARAAARSVGVGFFLPCLFIPPHTHTHTHTEQAFISPVTHRPCHEVEAVLKT